MVYYKYSGQTKITDTQGNQTKLELEREKLSRHDNNTELTTHAPTW